MFPDAEEFLQRFRETRYDVICRTSCEELFKIAEYVAVVGAFRFLSERFDTLWATAAYWLLTLLLMLYVGNRVSYFVVGVVRGRGEVRAWHDWILLPAIIVTAIGVALFVRHLVDAIVLQQLGS